MPNLIKSAEQFKFYTRLHLSELTGLRAATLTQLLELIKSVPASSIYHHTHRFLQQHQYLSPEPPNDFAYWVSENLGEDELGERLASIDTIQYSSIEGLRQEIAGAIRSYLKTRPLAKLRFAKNREEFYFLKSISFIIPTGYSAASLEEFSEVLKKITIDSIYFHIFEARLRLEKATNDFSNWIANSIGDKGLADEISGLDPYTYTLEELRQAVARAVEKHLGG